MVKFIPYLLEASAVLAFFYLIYVLILRRETFFGLNRFFLIGSLAFSLLFPFLSFDFISEKVVVVEQPIEEISKFRMSYYEAMALWEFNAYRSSEAGHRENLQALSVASQTDWAKLIITICWVLYATGVVICLSRTVWTLRWIWKMIAVHPHEKTDGVHVVKLPHSIAPFSFLKYVFVPDALVGSPEFDQILAHEKTHVRQKHSIDLIFVQLLAAFLWFNPVIWQLIKSLKATHEYIADKKIINSGYSLVEYQTLLLRQLISNNSYGLVHNFNLSFIKKRIIMMKNKKSGWSGKVKVAMAIACTVIFSLLIVQCNSKLEEQVSEEPDNELLFDVKIVGIENQDIFNRGIAISDLDQMKIDPHNEQVKVDEFEITLARGSSPVEFQEVKGNTYDLALFSNIAEPGDRLIIETKNLVYVGENDLTTKNSILTIPLK